MKKLFLITCMFVLVYNAKSQNRFGIKAGLNVANQHVTITVPEEPTIAEDTKPIVGYQAGAFYRIKLSTKLSLHTEANFSVIGSKRTLMTPDLQMYDAKEKLGYVEVPLILEYSINKFHAGVGASAGFKLFGKLTNFEDKTFDIPYYRTMDVAGDLFCRILFIK